MVHIVLRLVRPAERIMLFGQRRVGLPTSLCCMASLVILQYSFQLRISEAFNVPMSTRGNVRFNIQLSVHEDNIGQVEEFDVTRDEQWYVRNSQNVIVVDDDEYIRLAVGDYLFDKGFKVTACADADALLEVLEDKTERLPDVIVSDVRMPGKDGLELTKMLKADERYMKIPIVLLTAKGLSVDRILGYRSGADAYLSKPFDPEELLAIIDNIVERQEQMIGGKENETLMNIKDDISLIKSVLKERENEVLKPVECHITPMEREVLSYLGQGLSNQEIADARGVNKNGVQKAISNLYAKTYANTRTELIRWAIQRGFSK